IEAADPARMPAAELSPFHAIPIWGPLSTGVPFQASRSHTRSFLWRRKSRYGNCRTMFLAFGILFRVSCHCMAVRSWRIHRIRGAILDGTGNRPDKAAVRCSKSRLDAQDAI